MLSLFKFKTGALYGRKQLSLLRSAISSSYVGTNNYAIIYSDRHVKQYIHHACYAMLSGLERRASPPYMLISTIKDSFDEAYQGEKKQQSIKFLDWLVNYSPWHSVFHTRCGEEAFSLGMMCKTKLPANLILGGLLAARETSEVFSKVLTWCKLVEIGVSPTFAYYASYFLYYKENCFVVMTSPIDNWHRPLNVSRMGVGDVRNFLLEKPKNITETLYNYGNYTGEINRLWGNNGSWGALPLNGDRFKKDAFKNLAIQLLDIERGVLNG